MLAWLLILLVMVAVVLTINPEAAAYSWYQSLRRPGWLRFHLWLPMLWLPLYGCLYLSAVFAWDATRRLPLLLWLPVEAWSTWSLLRLNAAAGTRSRARPPR